MGSLRVEHVYKTFDIGSVDGSCESVMTALYDVSFEITEGTCVVFGGENGSGKSVLMSIIAGIEEPDKGTVNVDCGIPSGEKKVGLVFQEAETQILGETPSEDIAFGPKNLGWNRHRVEDSVKAALEKTGLTAKKDFPARFLSGGEKRRLAVACLLAMDLPVIILDEPYANLDYIGVKQVNQLLIRLKKEGKTVIVLTHEIEKCLGLADRFIVLFQGKKVFDGAASDAVKQNLEQWNIRNPFNKYESVSDLIWR